MMPPSSVRSRPTQLSVTMIARLNHAQAAATANVSPHDGLNRIGESRRDQRHYFLMRSSRQRDHPPIAFERPCSQRPPRSEAGQLEGSSVNAKLISAGTMRLIVLLGQYGTYVCSVKAIPWSGRGSVVRPSAAGPHGSGFPVSCSVSQPISHDGVH